MLIACMSRCLPFALLLLQASGQATLKPTICAEDDPTCKPVLIKPVGDANYVDCVDSPGANCVSGNNIVAQAPFDPLSACPTDPILGGTTSQQDVETQIAVCVNAVRETPDAFACLYPCSYAAFREDVTSPPRGGLTFTGTAPAAQLQSMAKRHSLDMATKNFFAHTGSDNSTLADRATDADFNTFPLGENIAAGYNTVRAVVLAWMCSPGHRTNLMACGFDTVGTAAETNVTSDYKIYYTQDFGCSRDDWNCQCPSIVNASSGAAPSLPPLAACPGQAQAPVVPLITPNPATPPTAPATPAAVPPPLPATLSSVPPSLAAAPFSPAPTPLVTPLTSQSPTATPTNSQPVINLPSAVPVPPSTPAAPPPTTPPALAPVLSIPMVAPASPVLPTAAPLAMAVPLPAAAVSLSPISSQTPPSPATNLPAGPGCLYVTSMELSGGSTTLPATNGDSALVLAAFAAAPPSGLQLSNISLSLTGGAIGNVSSVQRFPAQPNVFLIQVYHPAGFVGTATLSINVGGTAAVSYQVVDRPLRIQTLGFSINPGSIK